jgi:uncharacterized protein (DUF1697 family)
MAVWTVLLRGINVGSHRRLPMAGLREALGVLGYADVATLGQSGNVVLRSEAAARDVERAVERVVEEACGVGGVLVVARSREELAGVVDANPFPDAVEQPKLLQVSFCSGQPDPDAIREIESRDLGDERIAVRGREVYAFHPGGVHESPLARQLTDRQLGVTATARNWNTIAKLLELAARGP